MKKIIVILLLAIILLGSLLGFQLFKGDQAADAALEDNAVVNEPAVEENADEAYDGLSFSTTALDGSAVDESIFEGKSLVMLNFWEPWCGPCVQEMPDLQRLSEDYAEKGFLIVGVYSTESGAANIVEQNGITYPIIKYCDDFSLFRTGYVPTTAFVDGSGQTVGELVVGAKSYDDWAALIEQLMSGLD